MFAPEGWVSLAHVYNTISSAFQLRGYFGDIKFFGDESFEVTWLFLQEAPRIAICLPNGKVLAASRYLVQATNHYDNLNDHIDIIKGTVGSAHSKLMSGNAPDEFELKLRYGAFLFAPIILLEQDFIDFLDEFDRIPEEFLAPRGIDYSSADDGLDQSPRAVCDEIVRAYDSGNLPKFADAKKSLGPRISVRAFRFAWNLAKEKRPKISKPGPKVKKTKS